MAPTPAQILTPSLLSFSHLPSLTFLELAISKALTSRPPALDIAVPLLSSFPSRRKSFYTTEKIVSTIYALTKDTDTEVRVLLTTSNTTAAGGVVLHDDAVKRGHGRWTNITIAGSDKGWEGVKATVIPTGLDTGDQAAWWEAKETEVEWVEHTYTVVGGTFDTPIHAGHKLLLTMTFYLLAKGVFIVGLTGSELLKNKTHGEYLTSWTTRCDGVISFLRAITLSDAKTELKEEKSDLPTTTRLRKFEVGEGVVVEVHEIQDAYGPTISVEAVSTLTVSEETRGGGEAVNVKRREKGWGDLEVFVVGLVGGDGEGKLSSTEVRRKKMERGSPKARV